MYVYIPTVIAKRKMFKQPSGFISIILFLLNHNFIHTVYNLFLILLMYIVHTL